MKTIGRQDRWPSTVSEPTGFAMITVLLTLVVMSVVAAVAVKVSLTDRQATWAVRDGESASFASEAGVHRAWANWPANADSLAPGDSIVLGWMSMADGKEGYL